MAAVLEGGAGTMTSHLAGAALWRIPGFPSNVVEVARVQGAGRQRGSTLGHLHTLRALDAQYCTEVEGIPVTSLPLTLFHLAALATPPRRGVYPDRVERAMNSIVSRSPAILPVLHDMLPVLAESGRNGIVLMRDLLDKLPIGCVPPSSGAELEFERILADAGERPMERQVDVGGHSWIGRVDYVDWEIKLVCEIDSATYHASPLDRARDAKRDEQLLAVGFAMVRRIASEDLWGDRFGVLMRVRAARRELRRGVA
jgi:very-short-patch-repair endonuclease